MNSGFAAIILAAFTAFGCVSPSRDELLKRVEELEQTNAELRDRYVVMVNDSLKRATERAAWLTVLSTFLDMPAEERSRFHIEELTPNPEEHYGGAAMARADVKAGHFAIFTGGLSVYRPPVVARLQQHNISVYYLGGCTLPSQAFGFADAYNSVSKPAIEAKYGKDFLVRMIRQSHIKTGRQTDGREGHEN